MKRIKETIRDSFGKPTVLFLTNTKFRDKWHNLSKTDYVCDTNIFTLFVMFFSENLEI
jgi:hypothetical protein